MSESLGTGRKNDGMRPNLLKIPYTFKALSCLFTRHVGIGLNHKFGYFVCSYRKCLQYTIFIFFCNVPNKTPHQCNGE